MNGNQGGAGLAEVSDSHKTFLGVVLDSVRLVVGAAMENEERAVFAREIDRDEEEKKNIALVRVEANRPVVMAAVVGEDLAWVGANRLDVEAGAIWNQGISHEDEVVERVARLASSLFSVALNRLDAAWEEASSPFLSQLGSLQLVACSIPPAFSAFLFPPIPSSSSPPPSLSSVHTRSSLDLSPHAQRVAQHAPPPSRDETPCPPCGPPIRREPIAFGTFQLAWLELSSASR